MKSESLRAIGFLLGVALLLPDQSRADTLTDGREAFRKGDYARAIVLLEQASEADRSVDVELKLARSYVATGELDRGERHAAEIAKSATGGTKAEALVILGDALARKGNWHVAVQRYVEATQAAPEHAEIWLSLGQALQHDARPEQAEVAFAAYRTLKPAR